MVCLSEGGGEIVYEWYVEILELFGKSLSGWIRSVQVQGRA